jgi:ribokinase
VKQAARAIEQADVVVCQLETPLAATMEAFRLARAADKRTVLTPAPVVELPDELLQHCDVCVLNRTEIEFLVGHAVHGPEDALLAAKSLMARGVQAVVITLGKDGAFIADSTQRTHIPVIEVEAIDTTGAGDAFTAAIAVSLAEGLNLTEAAQRASWVAALTVTRLGTQTAFPRRREVDERMVPTN